jgi:hypothetical protein
VRNPSPIAQAVYVEKGTLADEKSIIPGIDTREDGGGKLRHGSSVRESNNLKVAVALAQEVVRRCEKASARAAGTQSSFPPINKPSALDGSAASFVGRGHAEISAGR